MPGNEHLHTYWHHSVKASEKVKQFTLIMNLQMKTLWNWIIVLAVLILKSHSATDVALITLQDYFCVPSKCNVWCYLPFIIPFALITTLRPQENYLQITVRTGKNYFFFHFGITFVIAQINSVSSGNIYSYATLRNVLPMQTTLTFQYSGTCCSFKAPLYNIPW